MHSTNSTNQISTKLNDLELHNLHSLLMVDSESTVGVTNAVNDVKINNNRDIIISTIDEETKSFPEETIMKRLKEAVENQPNHEVLKYKSDPKKDFDLSLTMKEYFEQITKAATGFITLGLKPQASVCILGFNHPAWFISELGGIYAGGVSCGIYATNTAEICKYIMVDCQCQIVVLENNDHLNKILSILPEVSQLKAIIKYTGEISEEAQKRSTVPIYTWSQFLNIDSSNAKDELEKRQENIQPKDCAVLIYTSGTTGLPKGVMLSHDNILFTLSMIQMHLDLKKFENIIVSYLPLSHIAANMLDIASTVAMGSTIYFAQPDALKGSLGNTLKEVRPTVFLAVPRVLEKIQEQLEDLRASTNKKLDPIKVKKGLGLDRCEYIASGAAPISQQTLEFFQDLDILIHQIYGMSESCGPHTVGQKHEKKLGFVGNLMKGVELKIENPDDNQIGEICMRGRHVFLGYFNAKEKTREALDSDNWLHSGDLGQVDEEGYLKVTGRIKELLITAGGENIAPVPIEDNIKSELPFISNAMLVGDRKKFISCLLTLKTEVDSKTQLPTEKLSVSAIRSLESFGIEAREVEDLLDSSNLVIRSTIDNAMRRVNAMSVSRAAHVQKWKILPRDFSLKSGELGPTLKVKRMVVMEKYEDVIKSMYAV